MSKMELKSTSADRYRMMASAASGLLLTAAFPRLEMAFLAWVALVPLLAASHDLPTGDRFRLGFITGLAHYLTLIYWLIPTMQTYGGIPVLLAIPILFLLAAYLALYPAVFAAAAAPLGKKPAAALFVFPALWVTLEYLRSTLLSGFPWELLGYSQYGWRTLIQVADITGVYGVSFLLVMGNTAVFFVALHLTGKKWRGKSVNRPIAAGSLAAVIVLAAGVLLYGNWRIQAVEGEMAAAPTTRAAVVQGNIEQTLKWDPAFQTRTVRKYVDLSVSLSANKPDLVIWPETATPFYLLKDPQLTRLVMDGIRKSGTDFLIGSPAYRRHNSVVEYFNSAYLISLKEDNFPRYDKAHLVPFGEYVPLGGWFPFIKKIVQGPGDFRPGKAGETLLWGDISIGVQICYEIIFPNLARAMTRNGAGLLVNITNDAWYGRSSAPYQHFSMAVFRAIENRRSVVRSANTGISGFIDPTGRVLAATELFEDRVMSRPVPILRQQSFYVTHGDAFAALAALLTAVALALSLGRKNRRKH